MKPVFTMRTSDAERQRAAEFLRDACGDGRLSPEELEERLERCSPASTVADIAVLVRDLPGGAAVIPRLGRPRSRSAAAATVPPRRSAGAPALAGGAVRVRAARRRPRVARVRGASAAARDLLRRDRGQHRVVVGVFAVALAPVGLVLFGIAWLVQRVFRGPATRRRGPGRACACGASARPPSSSSPARAARRRAGRSRRVKRWVKLPRLRVGGAKSSGPEAHADAVRLA